MYGDHIRLYLARAFDSTVLNDPRRCCARWLAHSSTLYAMAAHPPNHKNNPPTNRHSPVAPLAPLEFLQNLNQRRGSITDPSLHAATPRQTVNSQFFRQDKSNVQEPRPVSPYVFGSATHAESNTHLRKLLRTPSPHSTHENSQGSSSRTQHDSFRGPGVSVCLGRPKWLPIVMCLSQAAKKSTAAIQ